MKKTIRKEEGVTLIALVITIVILIILTWVTIGMVIGDSGLIHKTYEAKSKSEDAQIEELLNMYRLEMELDDTETLKEKILDDQLVDEKELEENGIAAINDKYIIISDFKGLQELSKNVEEGNDYKGKKVYITNDIDCGASFNRETGELLQGENFNPIGNSNSRIENEEEQTSVKTEFNGELDGFYYTIRNLYIKENEETEFCTGLFGYVGKDGVIKNLTITDSYIQGYYETGAFVGRNQGIIENCINETDVIGDYHLTGGIAGRNTNIIRNCINRGNIQGGSSEGESSQTGGIVGNCDFNANVLVENCKNYGSVQAEGNYLGGIAGGIFNTDGESYVTVKNCENYGIVKSDTNPKIEVVGGIIGNCNSGLVQNCVNKANVSGYSYIGGIVGRKYSTTIEYCYNEEEIDATYSNVGGIVGASSGGIITKCANKGKVYLSEQGFYGAGGISGNLGSNTESSTIELCFNIGEVYSLADIDKGRQAGGIVGNVDSNEMQEKKIMNCYNLGYIHGIGAIGGIIGYAKNVNIQNCYNAGKLEIEEGKAGYKGGIISSLYPESTNNYISNNYWLSDCGASYGIANTSNNDGAENRNSEQLKELSEVLGEHFMQDIDQINQGYPYLKENKIQWKV